MTELFLKLLTARKYSYVIALNPNNKITTFIDVNIHYVTALDSLELESNILTKHIEIYNFKRIGLLLLKGSKTESIEYYSQMQQRSINKISQQDFSDICYFTDTIDRCSKFH